jgi:Fe2+ or Zn2+ uptake regulation protein
MTNTNRRNELADLLRTGQGTPTMEAEYAQLETEHRAIQKPSPIYRSIYDLPIAKRMWEADTREVEG